MTPTSEEEVAQAAAPSGEVASTSTPAIEALPETGGPALVFLLPMGVLLAVIGGSLWKLIMRGRV